MEPNEQDKTNAGNTPAAGPVVAPTEGSASVKAPEPTPMSTATPTSTSVPAPESVGAPVSESNSTINPESTINAAASPVAETSTNSMKSGNKIGLWVGLGVGTLVLVGGIVAAILIPQMMKPDYNKMYDLANSLGDEVYNYFYSSACHDVRLYVDSYYSAEANEYAEYVNNCRNDAAKIYAEIEKFEAESNVSKDSEINELYLKFKKTFDEKAPGKDRIEQTLKVYEAIHNFVSEVKGLGSDLESMPTPSEFKEISESLANSGDERLRGFAEGLNQRYETLYEKYRSLSEMDYSDSNYMTVYEEYLEAGNELSDYFNEQSDVIDDLDYPLADTSGRGDDSVVDTFSDLESAIVEKAK